MSLQPTARPFTLPAFFADLASRHGSKPALAGDDRTSSFVDLHERSLRLATGLRQLGVQHSDRVAVWLPNVPEWMELFAACGQIGAIVVALNTRFRSREVTDILSRTGAKALALWPDYKPLPFLDILAQVDYEQLPSLEVAVVFSHARSQPTLPAWLERKRCTSFAALVENEIDVSPQQQVLPEDGCLIYTTSGTTSLPKFVLHSHRSMVQHALDVAGAQGSYGADGSVGLNLMPLCGAFGMTQTMGALAGGATTHLPTAFDAARAAAIIREHRVTNMAAVDEVFYRMLDLDTRTPAFPALRYVPFGSFNGSASDFIRIADARGVRGVGAYGMSEIQGLFSLQPAEASTERRAIGGGRPVSALAEVRVRDPETGSLVSHGVAGELEINAPSMMSGYFGDPDATRAAMTDDGFIRSGDLGTLLEDGSFTFLSRMGDTLRLSGFLVSPAEIARHVEEHEAVAECQVVGAHAADGFRPVAFVVLEPGAALNEPALLKHCSSSLAKYKVPVRFVALESFPATDGPNGLKVQRNVLREMAQRLLNEG